MNSLQLYFRYVAISLRSQLQYRASFYMAALGQLLITAIEFLGIAAVFHRFGNLRGWNLPEIALFYGTVNLSFPIAEAFARGFDTFPNLIKQGDFDRILLRPRAAALQVLAQELQLMRFGRLLQGLAVLLWGAHTLHLSWSPAKIALLLLTILAGAAVFSALMILQATAAFWTIESLEIFNATTYGGVEAARYPLAIYPKAFQRFFTFVIPLAGITYFPLLLILNRPNASPLAAWTGPLLGLAFFALSTQIWTLGVRHYRSTGH